MRLLLGLIASIYLGYTGRYSSVQHFRSTCATQGESLASTNTATLTFRIEPELKEAVRAAAVNEHRSIANMIAVMIRSTQISCSLENITQPPG